MLKLNYNSKGATSRKVGKKRLGERLPRKKLDRAEKIRYVSLTGYL
jgi:hypothetical protein